jgi:hypothetical protein
MILIVSNGQSGEGGAEMEEPSIPNTLDSRISSFIISDSEEIEDACNYISGFEKTSLSQKGSSFYEDYDEYCKIRGIPLSRLISKIMCLREFHSADESWKSILRLSSQVTAKDVKILEKLVIPINELKRLPDCELEFLFDAWVQIGEPVISEELKLAPEELGGIAIPAFPKFGPLFASYRDYYATEGLETKKMTIAQACIRIRMLVKNGPISAQFLWGYIETKLDEKIDVKQFIDELNQREDDVILIKSDQTAYVDSHYEWCSVSWWMNNGRRGKIISPDRKKNRLSYLDSEKKERFSTLYSNYITGLKNCLSFEKCSGKLTRVNKLFHKPLNFPAISVGKDNRTSIHLQPRITLDTKSGYISKNIHALGELFKESNIPHTSKDIKGRNDGGHFLDMYSKFENHHSLKYGSLHKYLYHKSVSPIEKTRILELRQLRNRLAHYMVPTPSHKQFTRSGEKQSFGIDSDEFIHYSINHGGNFIPLIVEGGAGMGKTISIKQISLKFITQIEKKLDNRALFQLKTVPFPMFLKARRLVNPIQKMPDIDLDHLLAFHIVNSLPLLDEYISLKEIVELIGLWGDYKQLHNSREMLFIDALDECPTKRSSEEIINWILQSLPYANLMLSTRPSHISVVKSKFTHYSISPISFSENELKENMPRMLCDAWGITRELTKEVDRLFSTYSNVLIHPLFVGWFCFLIHTEEIEEIIDQDKDPDITQNELIAKIIEVGIRASLDRRESKIDNMEKFEKTVRVFVAVSHHYKTDSTAQIYGHLRDKFDLELNKDEKSSIENDCGILFLYGKTIDWTHNTIPELIYADFISTDENKKKLWGPMRSSSPIRKRIAQLRFECGDFDSYEEAFVQICFEDAPRKEWSELVRDKLFDIDIFNQPNKGKQQYIVHVSKQGRLSLSPDLNPTIKMIGKLYIENIEENRRFPLPSNLINGDTGILYRMGKDPFGRDVLSSPELGENLVKFNQLNVKRIHQEIEVVDCFQFYRQALMNEPIESLKLDSPVFFIHNTAENNEGIFNLARMSAYVWNSDPGLEFDINAFDTWFPEWSVGEETKWINPRKEHFQYIRTELVHTAFSRLFGTEDYGYYVDKLWDELSTHESHYVTNKSDTESSEVLDYKLLDILLHDAGIPTIRWPMEIIDKFPIHESSIKGLLLFPFIDVCLSHCAYLTHTASEYLDEIFELNNKYWWPYQMVAEFSPNLGGRFGG